jgi:DNA repair protein RadC
MDSIGDAAVGARERLAAGGATTLSDGDLLALLLGTGVAGEPVARVAAGLLERFGTLRRLARAAPGELTAAAGIGPAKAARLAAVTELARRIAKESAPPRPQLASPRQVFEFVAFDLRDLGNECFEVLMLDVRHRLIRRQRVSMGTLDSSLVHPREVFRQAVAEGAAGIILVHNHPSGDPSPSREDLDVTRRLVSAGEVLGIRVFDHVIVGDDRFVSLAETGDIVAAKK